MEHKRHGHHGGVKHSGAAHKDQHQAYPKSGNHKAARAVPESGNNGGCMHWSGSEHHDSHRSRYVK